jgi:ABC-2 type transport system permease protein
VSAPTAVVSPTVVRLGVRSVFGRRRGVLLFVLPVVLIGLAALVRGLVGDDPTGAQHTLQGLGLVVVVPLVALLATTGLLAPEIDDGSIAYLLAKPVPRSTIVLSKLVVAWGCVVAFGVLPVLLAGLVLRPTDPAFALGFALGALAGGLAYCVLFALLSVLSRHAVVIGLVYLLIWESLLGGLLDGVRWLSVGRWSQAITEPVADVSLVDGLGAGYAVVATVVVVVVGGWLTARRLRGFNLTGDE